MLSRSFVVAILALALSLGCYADPRPQQAANHPAAAREKIIVLAAASTTEAIEQVARAFEQSAAVDVQISTGPSNGLALQIIAGAPADVYLSANQKWADAVAEEGLAGETVDLLTNSMVLVVPRGNPAGVAQPADLTSELVTRVAIAGENVPAGIYAEQALRKLGDFEQLQSAGKLARGADVRITLAYVERGEAEAGIVYATDARLSEQVEVVVEIDRQLYDPVVYPAVLLKAATGKQAAREFFEFMQSLQAEAIFSQFGFTPLATQRSR